MKATNLAISAAVLVAGVAITCTILRVCNLGHEGVASVVGAILGCEVAVVLHHRQPGSTLSMKVKAQVGAVLAITSLAVSAVLQLAAHWEEYPEVVMPITAVGCFVFPFVICGTMWNAMEKAKKARDDKA